MSTELLLPVGNKEMALAAIHNGADAIYVGVPGFNARGRSSDFDEESLRDLIETCHLYGVKVNLAFNVVIFEHEIPSLVLLIQKIIQLGPDAFIVQDLGLAELIRQMAPDQVIHGSTQMTVTNHEAISLLDDLKIKRFVLGRENSLSEIALIKANTEKELEVFVHGALCVSYSGQCFTSESLGGRSANRGQCAQSCRFSYDLVVDGEKRPLGGKKYLVSPQDLCGIDEIPELIKLGVSSFKVEGRLKTPDYVATAARSYRQVMDQKLSKPISSLRRDMEASYSRGFFSGWLHGVNHQQLVDASFSSHRGYQFGSIIEVDEDSFVVQISSDTPVELEAGDGLLLVYQERGKEKETGGFLYSAKKIKLRDPKNELWRVSFARDVQPQERWQGAKVYLNHDRDLKSEVPKSWQDRSAMKRIPIKMRAKFQEGFPLQVLATDGVHAVQAESPSPLAPAKNRGLSDELLREELSALSGSPFWLESLEIERTSDSALFLNHKELKELRRKLQEQLALVRRRPKPKLINEALPIETLKKNPAPVVPRLNLLLRDKAQVEALVKSCEAKQINPGSLNSVILDFEFGRDVQSSLELLKSQNLTTGVATTRILKPGEYRHLKSISAMKPDLILVRNLGAIQYFTKIDPCSAKLIGDFSLNVTNSRTAKYLLNKGLKSVCLSYDLNSKQVNEVLAAGDSSKMEVTLHQYMPSFHMEHCVFASTLSQGTSFRDCGKPCEKHRVELVDQFGHRHFLKADHECRNTMFNSTPQSALRFLKEWSNLGLGQIRYEALFETGEEMLKKLSVYIKVLNQEILVDEALKELAVLENYGLGEGPIAKTQEYQSRKKEL